MLNVVLKNQYICYTYVHILDTIIGVNVYILQNVISSSKRFNIHCISIVNIFLSYFFYLHFIYLLFLVIIILYFYTAFFSFFFFQTIQARCKGIRIRDYSVTFFDREWYIYTNSAAWWIYRLLPCQTCSKYPYIRFHR